MDLHLNVDIISIRKCLDMQKSNHICLMVFRRKTHAHSQWLLLSGTKSLYTEFIPEDFLGRWNMKMNRYNCLICLVNGPWV